MKPWDVYWAMVRFEDKNQKKRRPVLITKSGVAYQLVFKMTTKERDHELEYKLIDWSGAGLKSPTTVRLQHKLKLGYTLKDSDFIGTIQDVDREEILRLCKKYNISVDDLK